MFDLSQDEEVVVEKDSLGAGAQLDSNVYDFTVDMAYVTESTSGAAAMNFVLKTDSGAFHRETIYMTSGKAKGQKTFYIHPTTGKKHNLPGFTQVYNIVAITLNKSLKAAVDEAEQKTIMLYDYKVGKEVPTVIDKVLVNMIGKRVKLGLKVVVENKNAKNSDGKYVATPEKREYREISIAFFPDSNLTVKEKIDGEKDPQFYTKWLEKWEGQVQDKYDPNVKPLEPTDNADTSDENDKLFG